MIAQPIRTQAAFEFLVAILALASLGVLIVGRFRQDVGATSIRDHRAAVGALRVGLAFDDRKSGLLPGAGLIPKRVEQSLRFGRLIVPGDSFVQQFPAFPL